MPGWTRRALLLAIPLLALYVFWRARSEPPGSRSPSPPNEPASMIRGLRLVDEDVDGTRWTIKASAGTGWESEGTGTLSNVTAVFEKGGKNVEVRAPLGEASKGEVLTVSGGVHVLWGEFEATTDRATYFRGKGVIKSDAAVALVGRKLKVEGKGFEVDVEGKTVRVLSNVKATVGGRNP